MNEGATTMAPFCCQGCFAPLKLHTTLKTIDSAEFKANTRDIKDEPVQPSIEDLENLDKQRQQHQSHLSPNPNPNHNVLEDGSSSSSNRKRIASSSSDFSSSTGLARSESVKLRQARPTSAEIDDSTAENRTTGQPHTAALSLFDFISSRSDIDHPLCESCTDLLLDKMDSELQALQLQFQNEQRLASEIAGVTADEDAAQLEKDIEKLAKEEEELMEAIASAEKERTGLMAEHSTLDQELNELKDIEQEYWREYNEYQRELLDFEEKQETIEHKYTQAKRQLDLLKKTNVFNDAFHIWYDGHFGTINGFRLGRLPTVPVGWDEVNAAWGNTVLLLQIMVQRLDFKFDRYTLYPNGSFSRIHKVGEKGAIVKLPLYTQGSKLFSDTAKFDQGMEAFLDCLRQFKDSVDARDPHFKLPYTINGSTISDSNVSLPIKLQHNTEEDWTKALKYMLTNLKWSLAWMCKQMAT